MRPTVFALLTLFASTAVADLQVEILPGSFTLNGSTAKQMLVVESLNSDGYTGQLRASDEVEISFTSSDEKVVDVRYGVATPVGDGTATITVKVKQSGEEATATSQVTVTGAGQPQAWTFRNHVLPVLAKAGCNSGACHGALAGKGGFKLSLRGYDPVNDYKIITRQARGRRIELSDPGRSLLVAKPAGDIPHKGGVRLERLSDDYNVLARWIANGAPAPQQNDPQLERLEVLPAAALLQPGDKQQVLVRAHYTDGSVEDVTRWAKFASTSEAVASVGENGLVSVTGYGEGAITAWFSSKIVIARVTSPFANKLKPETFEKEPRRNFVDRLVLKQLQRLNLPPSPLASDEEFFRRVHVDTIGVLPTIEETTAFLKDESPGKRDKLIEELLNRPEFVDYWTYKWSDVLLVNGNLLRPGAVKSFYMWIRKHVKEDTPWDEFTRQILTARGSTFENGAANFYALHQTPEDMTENACQAFMGLSIGCAKCHNHPLEKWTNDQYYGMANLFSRVRAKGWGGDTRNGDGNQTVYVTQSGELMQPLTGKPQPPTPLDGEAVPFDAPGDRREHLAKWMTSPENPYFARAITNRIWANFFGVGLVEQVDDLRMSNPASNEELLAAASDYLKENKFQLKSLMRVILQSATYQRSSQPLPGNRTEKRFYSRYYPRRMKAEVLLDAVSKVTGAGSRFTEVLFPGGDKKATDFYPAGTRALELYDSAVGSYFLKTFGRNQRRITCECERSDEPSLVQVLHIANGDTINKKLQAKDNVLAQQLKAEKSEAELVDEAYLAALSRHPTKKEKDSLLAEFKAAGDDEKRLVLEDVYWAIFASREFLFNH